MQTAVILMEDYLYEFYRKAGQLAGGIPAEQIMADILSLQAGKLDMRELRRLYPSQT